MNNDDDSVGGIDNDLTHGVMSTFQVLHNKLTILMTLVTQKYFT